MAQISFKIPDSEMKFLAWLAQKTAQPISTIYRNATMDSFQQWKINYLLKKYQKGEIGFKKLCLLANISFNQGSLLLQEYTIEPPISELIDKYTTIIAQKFRPEEIFKDGKIPVRKSPEVNITNLDDDS